MNKKILIISLILIFSILTVLRFYFLRFNSVKSVQGTLSKIPEKLIEEKKEPHPLSIEYQKNLKIEGSPISIIRELPSRYGYKVFLTSYISEGLKIQALLTIPTSEKPEGGFPAIVFNHGYIPPEVYRTTERYDAYVDYFARNGYVVFKPDYRGHGESEGTPQGGYYSSGYTLDVLNATASLAKHGAVNPNKLGMWGHSMGGHLTLRSILVNKNIKAAVIWAGVVANYEDMSKNWRRPNAAPFQPSPREQASRGQSMSTRQKLSEQYGEPNNTSDFWYSISPINFVSELTAPVQIHHGTSDAEVPVLFSLRLKEALEKVNKPVEYYEYPGADHNLSGNAFGPAMQRSLEFFNKYVKNS